MSYYRIRKDITTTPLAVSGVYTGENIHLNQYDRLTGIVYSDQAGSLDVQQSIDGTNWDFVTTIAVTAETGASIDVKVYGEWARLVYTNSTTAQTEFRMAAYATPMGG